MITKAALILFRQGKAARELMFVRADKPYYVFPGGKQEPGETIERALKRELKEELDCESSDYKKLGILEGRTPDGRPIQMHLYSAVLIGEPVPSSEIKEIAWMDEKEILAKSTAMTPMTLTKVLPFLKERSLL